MERLTVNEMKAFSSDFSLCLLLIIQELQGQKKQRLYRI